MIRNVRKDMSVMLKKLKIPSLCEIFRACPDRPWGPPNLLYNEYRVTLLRGGSDRGVELTTHII
jgi:hypothetical protein